MSSPPYPTSPKQDLTEKYLSPKPTALPQTSLSSSPPPSEPTVVLETTLKTTSNRETSTDTSPVLIEKNSPYSPTPTPTRQNPATSSNRFSTIATLTSYNIQYNNQPITGVVHKIDNPEDKPDKGSDSRGKHFSKTSQVKNFSIPEANYTEAELSDKTPELTEDTTISILASRTGGLSAMAPEFLPVGYATTNTDGAHDRGCNHQGRDNPPETQQGILDPPTPVSQISEIAAEVADTAAMLDVTPPELAIPEIPSILGGIGSLYPRSPIVELVEEESLTPLSEVSRVAAEVADTAAMLDRFSPPGGQFIVSPGAYAAEQTLEEVHIGVIRMVQITGPDDSLIFTEEMAAIASSDSPTQEPSRQIGTTKLTTHLAPVPNEEQPTPILGIDNVHLIKNTPKLTTPPHLRTNIKSKLPYDTPGSELSDMSSISNLSTDQVDKNLPSKKPIGSIYIEDLVILASNLYATTWNVPTNKIKCVVNPNPRLGSKNLFYSIEFSNKYKIKTHKWIIRIPLSSSGFSSAEKSWLKSDIRAMEFIKEHTNIPIPFVYGYDVSTQNRIGTPYIFMDFMEGARVEDLWEAWDDEKKIRCLSQCAESVRKLGMFGFNNIGVLGYDHHKEEYTVHGTPSDTEDKGISLSGPYPSTKAYLDGIWRAEVAELRGNTKPEAVRARQSLILLKLLVPALVDLEPVTQQFFLTLPEFRGGNVLADYDGNIKAFVGWEKVMVMPKSMGYARYPEWITKDWVPLQENNIITATTTTASGIPRAIKPKTSSEIGRESLFEVPLSNEEILESLTDSKSIIRGYPLGESENAPSVAPLSSRIPVPSLSIHPKDIQIKEQNHAPRATLAHESSATDLSKAISKELVSSPVAINSQSHDDPAPSEGKRKQRDRERYYKNSKGNNWRSSHESNRGNRSQPRQRRNYNYDESIEIQRAITSEDKTKIQALSQWNSLAEKISKDEVAEREERKKAWMAKEEIEKATAINRARRLPPVIETFKKVVVEQDLERKLLEVVKTKRGECGNGAGAEDAVSLQLPKSSDMVRYRKIYHEHFTKISPEDELASKSSHISAAVHIAITNNKLRPSIVPKLAKHVIGDTVGPSILGMVGNGQWAEELLVSLDKGCDTLKKGVRFSSEEEGSDMEVVKGKENRYRKVWKISILGPAPVIIIAIVLGVSVMILSASMLLVWAFGFSEYHLRFTWSDNRYPAFANICLGLQTPALPQFPAGEIARVSAKIIAGYPLGSFFNKFEGVVNFVLDYNLTFVVITTLVMTLLITQGRTGAITR